MNSIIKISKKKVLIVIPVYNVELTIKKTLDSILNQDYTNYEVVISENHSTDNTNKILNEYLEYITLISPPVHLTSEKHYNFCLRFAKLRQNVDYIAIYHGDDIYSSEIVKLQVDFLNLNEDIPAVFSDGVIIDQADKIIAWVKNKKKGFYSSRYTFDEMLYGMISSTITCLTPTVMLRLSSIKKNKYELEPQIFGKAADYGLWLKMAKDYGCIGIIHQECIKYRRIGNNESSSIAKLSTESDMFKNINYYIINNSNIQTKNWEWQAHIERLMVQDYFRIINNLQISGAYRNELDQMQIPVVGFGYFIISFTSFSGIYYLFILIMYSFFRMRFFPVIFNQIFIRIIFNNSLLSTIRKARNIFKI